MALVKAYQSFFPQIHPSVYLAESATVIGEVVIGAHSSLWFQSVVRGDVGLISIGEATNVQDGVVIHCTTDRTTTHIGNRVVIGHGAILHGCRLEDEVLIGIGAIVLDEAVVPRHTIVAAGALVPERKVLESGWVYGGIPARPLRKVSPAEIDSIQQTAGRYVQKALHYRQP